MKQIRASVRGHLEQGGGQLWWPGLAPQLVRQRHHRFAFDPDQYSTSKFLGDKEPKRRLPISSEAEMGDLTLRLEFLDPSIVARMSNTGLLLVEDHDVSRTAQQSISKALLLIQLVPTLAATVDALVQSAHVLRSADPDMDVSHSDPAIPFSIFLSISEGKFADLRIAEAIIHEAMHLQLSLVEELVPLVADDGVRFHSPWKREGRPTSGVLHALYVFRTVAQWLDGISQATTDVQYVARRCVQIEEEISELDLDALSLGLTSDGRMLLERLSARLPIARLGA